MRTRLPDWDGALNIPQQIILLVRNSLPSPFSTVVVRVTRNLVVFTTYVMTRSIVRSGQWAIFFTSSHINRKSAWTLEI